jgi:hypothetical protein
MSQTSTVSHPKRRLLPTKLTTPQLLNAALYFTWGASLLLLIAILSGIQGQRQALKIVGKESVPSIITAQRIKDAMADMDADVANELIVKPGENQDVVKAFEERREKLSERLVAAAENITYGDAERKPLQTLQQALGNYIMKVQQARDFHAQGNSAAVLVTYRSAAEIMDNTLLPTADELDQVNLKELERIYAEERFAAFQFLAFVIIAGLLLIGLLIQIQLFLHRRMRRILNPMLMAATAIAIIFLGHTIGSLLSAANHLKVAKEDAFQSLHALRQARALAYSANGDESRYLLDTAFATKHEQAFFAKMNKLAVLPVGQKTFDSVIATAAQGKKVGMTGLLADELNNVTFPGEALAAIEVLSRFSVYLEVDKKIRQLEKSGKHQEAIALCTGNNPGQSNWAFDQLKDANLKAFDINDQAFQNAIGQGMKDLEGFEVTTPGVVGAIALLTLLGLLPRIKEYSA